jgi:nickel transport protein
LNSWNKVIIGVFCFLLIIWGNYTTASAHSLLIEPMEPGVIKVYYDGGGFSPKTVVTVFNQAGQQIYSGKLDQEGNFKYPVDIEAYRIIADDGAGHRARWIVGTKFKKPLPKLPVIAVVLAVSGAIAYIFEKRRGRSLASS